MRVLLACVAFLSLSFSSFSQVFTGTGGAIPGTSTTQTCFSQNVTGVGIIDGTKGLASVCINLTHPNDDELEIVLRAPDGTVVPLTIQNGGSGNNYITTCFTATATTPIKFGTAPFNGSYLPEGYLGAVNNGQNANGAWRLCIQDRRTGSNAGTLNSWTLTFNTTPAPAPPALPGCANTLPSNSSCATAALVCDFNGQCGSTSGSTVQDWTGSGLDGCFGLQNNSFIRFIASATTASFSVWVPTTTQASYNQGGIQMLFFSGTCNSGPVTTYGCYPHILPYSGTGQPLITVVTASGLTPGNTYYLMIDGFNNDNCTFTIAANTGVNILNVTPAAPSICAGGSVNLTASGGNGIYTWSPPTNLNTTSGTTVTANPPGTTTYTVTSTTVTGCPLTKNVTVTVNPLPAAPTATITQPTCGNPTATITINAPTGTGIQYSINGGPYQSSPVFTGLAPNTTYTVTVQNANSCTSNAPFTVNSAPTAPVAPTGTITQPTCTTPTGTITITAPTGTGLQYSINGGPYQSSPIFPGLTPNSYTITVQNAAGCTSPASLPFVINAAPNTPAAPTGTVTQPTCTTPTGTITITAPTGTGLQYSINGGPYQSSPTFPGLAPNSYTITVQNAAGCTSPASLPFVINAAPNTPAAPTGTVTQPTCTTPTGTITINAPTGTGLQYSINGGPYQSSPTFPGLTPNSYTITVQNAAGCTSPASLPFVVNAAPNTPAAPTGTVTQPTCTTPTGTITITAPTGTGLQYSINGGPYQSSPTFPGLAPNSYTITVQNAAGCTSPASLPFVVNAAPATPAAPTGTITQPTCTTPTGTITITAPTGTGLQYSINGGPYQSSPTFPGLTPNSYTITVQNAAGCTSPASSPFVVNAAPATPAAPTGTITQPTCTTPTGTITITTPTGTGLQYSINGGPYQSSPTFPGLTPNSYTITVQNAAGCTSPASSPFVVNAAPNTPAAPTGTITQPTCTTPTGTITITAPTGTGLQYSINGGPYQSSPTFPGLTPNSYTITVQNAAGCTSPASLPFVVNAAPATPAAPTGSVTTQPDCDNSGGTITITAPLGANYEYSVNGGGLYQPAPVFTNLPPNSYNVVVRDRTTGCVSPALVLTVINGPVRPQQPTMNTVQPDCNATVGSITVISPVGAGLQYNINGGAYQSSPVFNNLGQGIYLVTVKDASGCVSPINTAIILVAAGTPSKPVLVPTQPSCPARVGEIRVDAPVGANVEYSINGNPYQASNIFPNLVGGNYTVTARFIGTSCVSQGTTVQILGLTPEQCLLPANGDIYFPSAFTPNGDGKNDGFGPGPQANLANVSGYTLMVFNRYGELVFETTNPLAQWNGMYKGKMLANYSFTWVAKYRYGTRPVQMKKGSVTIIR